VPGEFEQVGDSVVRPTAYHAIYNWLLVSRLCGSQDASDIREPATQDGSLRK
jgi:hypothetical protein